MIAVLLWTLPWLHLGHPLPVSEVARAWTTVTDVPWTTRAGVGLVVWRTDGRLSVSGDGGRLWLPMAPQCRLQHEPSLWRVAVDAEMPGHVVVASPAADAPEDVAGCPVPQPCMRRSIAWTWNAQAQVEASRKMSQDAEDLEQIVAAIERSGGHAAAGAQNSPWGYADWRYANLAQLAVPRPGRTCRPSAPSPRCTAAPVPCHAALPDPAELPENTEAWCQDPASCTCQDQPGCALPEVGSLAIDPRDGTVLATTNAGLLTSGDGGRTWARTLRLETRQGLDLNREPRFLTQLGRLELAWQPCDPVARDPQSGRRRGLVTVSVRAWWQDRAGLAHQGTLRARSLDTCQEAARPSQPLVFREP